MEREIKEVIYILTLITLLSNSIRDTIADFPLGDVLVGKRLCEGCSCVSMFMAPQRLILAPWSRNKSLRMTLKMATQKNLRVQVRCEEMTRAMRCCLTLLCQRSSIFLLVFWPVFVYWLMIWTPLLWQISLYWPLLWLTDCVCKLPSSVSALKPGSCLPLNTFCLSYAV